MLLCTLRNVLLMLLWKVGSRGESRWFVQRFEWWDFQQRDGPVVSWTYGTRKTRAMLRRNRKPLSL